MNALNKSKSLNVWNVEKVINLRYYIVYTIIHSFYIDGFYQPLQVFFVHNILTYINSILTPSNRNSTNKIQKKIFNDRNLWQQRHINIETFLYPHTACLISREISNYNPKFIHTIYKHLNLSYLQNKLLFNQIKQCFNDLQAQKTAQL